MDTIIEIIFLVYIIVVSLWCGYMIGKMRFMNYFEQGLISEFYRDFKNMPEEQKNAFMRFYIDEKNHKAGDA